MKEALEFNRQDALTAAGSGYTETFRDECFPGRTTPNLGKRMKWRKEIEERIVRRSNLTRSRSFEIATPRIEIATHHISVVLAKTKLRSARLAMTDTRLFDTH